MTADQIIEGILGKEGAMLITRMIKADPRAGVSRRLPPARMAIAAI